MHQRSLFDLAFAAIGISAEGQRPAPPVPSLFDRDGPDADDAWLSAPWAFSQEAQFGDGGS